MNELRNGTDRIYRGILNSGEREKKENLVKHDSYYSTATYHKIAGFVVVK